MLNYVRACHPLPSSWQEKLRTIAKLQAAVDEGERSSSASVHSPTPAVAGRQPCMNYTHVCTHESIGSLDLHY